MTLKVTIQIEDQEPGIFEFADDWLTMTEDHVRVFATLIRDYILRQQELARAKS